MIQNVNHHKSSTEKSENTENSINRFSNFSDISDISDFSDNSVFSVACARDAANRWVPKNTKDVNRSLFQFAREMRAFLPDSTAEEMEPYLAIWYTVAVESVRDLDWSEVLCDFEFKLESVKFPAGNDPLSIILQEVEENEPPACATRFRGRMGRLVHILQRLQMKNMDKSIYMSGRVADRILGAKEGSAAKMFRYLVLKGVLEVDHSIESNEYRARRYFYRGDF